MDAVADPECADEPLFHNVPVPAEALYYLAIGRDRSAYAKLTELLKEIRPPSMSRIQAASYVQPEKVKESSSIQRLSKRHASQREHNQFFRSR